MAVKLLHYENETPTNEVIRRVMIGPNFQSGNYVYVVATTGQRRLREDLAFRTGASSTEEHCFVFSEYMRALLRQNRVSYLRRPEERVRLKEAMATVASEKNEQDRLQHDVFAWLTALAECTEREIDLRIPLLAPYSDMIVNQAVGDLLGQLDSSMRDLCTQLGYKTLSLATVEFLRGSAFNPPPLVLMEGFTFLTPLQHLFVNACVNRETTVRFLIPYRIAQPSGFAVMERTYGRYGGMTASTPFLNAEFVTQVPSGIARLRTMLMAEIVDPPTGESDGIKLLEFGHQSDEVTACIEEIRNLIGQGVTANQIAIVTRDPGAFHSRLQEEAQFQQLPVSLGIPPRHLLLTPLGRFALLLYRVLVNDRIDVDAQQFEAMMASGWLGSTFQNTVEAFQSVRWQFFVACRSVEEWEVAFKQLEDVLVDLQSQQRLNTSRMPAACATQDDVNLWRVAIERIEGLCRRIFAPGNQPINEHVRTLLNELNQLDPEDMRQYERELLDRIREALIELEQSRSIAVTPGEFGEVLTSMVQEYQNTAADPENEVVPQSTDNVIWVTTPEGIDCCSRDYVFYLGVDSDRVPRRPPEPWPFYRNEVANYQERERYLFLGVVRAVRQRLVLSFARLDEAGAYAPSPYLEQASQILGIPITRITLNPVSQSEIAPQAAPDDRPVRRERYTLSEIAIFGLCPFRYKLERLSRNARRYRTEFTTSLYAGSVWAERVLQHIVDEGAEFNTQEAAENAIMEAISITVGAMYQDFPSIRVGAWYSIRTYLESSYLSLMDWVAKQCGAERFRCQFIDLGTDPNFRTLGYTINGSNNTQIRIQVDGLRYSLRYRLNLSGEIPLFEHTKRSEWLLPVIKPQGALFPTEIDKDAAVFSDLRYALWWWDETMRAAFNQIRRPDMDWSKQAYQAKKRELSIIVDKIELGLYPKNPGEHCIKCPSRPECLGLEG